MNRIRWSATTLLVMTMSSQACAMGSYVGLPANGKGIVVDTDGKPVAGAMVVLWRETLYNSIIHLASSGPECEHEHYQETRADGSFDIPAKLVKAPSFRVNVSGLRIVAHKDGKADFYPKFYIDEKLVGADKIGLDPAQKNATLTTRAVLEPPNKAISSYGYWQMVDLVGCTCNPLANEFAVTATRLEKEWIDRRPKHLPTYAPLVHTLRCDKQK